MNLIVAGPRDFQTKLGDLTYYPLVEEIIEGSLLYNLGLQWVDDHSSFNLVSGMARGVDNLAWTFAKRHNIKPIEMWADWSGYPQRRDGGHIRNVKMGRVGHGLLAVRLGHTSGTASMIRIMEDLGKPVEIVDVTDLANRLFVRRPFIFEPKQKRQR